MKHFLALCFFIIIGSMGISTAAVPVASFTGSPTAGPDPLTVQFTDSSTNNPTGWAWFFGDEDWTKPAWTEVPLASGSKWDGRWGHTCVAMPDGSIILMGGWCWDNYNDVWRSTDNGATWTEMTPHAEWSGRDGHSSVAMPDGSIVLMGGNGGNDVWRSTDNGATWTQMTASAEWPARYDFSSVAMPDGSIILTGGSKSIANKLNDVWRSTDYGATWTKMTDSAEWWARDKHTSVAMPDGSIILMGGSSWSRPYWHDVWRSTDYGATWTQINASALWSGRINSRSVAMPDGSIVLMGGAETVSFSQGDRYVGDMYRSTDNGATWTQMTAANTDGINKQFSSVIVPDGSVIIMGGIGNGGFSNAVSRLVPTGSSIRNPSHIYTTMGTYNVSLQTYNSGGYSSIRKIGYISVAPQPAISSISPSTAPNTGTVIITNLAGANFQAGATVTLTHSGSADIVGTDVVVTSSKITCKFPISGKPAGAWNLVVKNPDGQTATKNDAFTITAPGVSPTITKITPASGYNSGNVATTIIGTNFGDKAKVKLTKGSLTKTGTVQTITSTQIKCIFPLSGAPAGTYVLTVTNANGKSAKKMNAFTVKAAGAKPTITSIKPNAGLSTKNTLVAITGTNFRAKAMVSIIKGTTVKKATIKSIAAKKILCTFPTKNASPGKWNVRITNLDGTKVTKTGGFTVKRTVSAKEVVAGQGNGIVSSTPVSQPLSAAPTPGSSLSYGALVPVNTPVVGKGIPVF